MTRTPSNGSGVYWSLDADSQVTTILHCHWLEFWGHDPDVWIMLLIISIKNETLLNLNNNWSKPEFLRLLRDIIIFRLVAYYLNMICLIFRILYKILHIYKVWYNFDTVLYQFPETGTSDRCLIGLNQLPRFSGVSLYPLSFFLYSPFKIYKSLFF